MKLKEHRILVADRATQERFRAAIHQVVRPGDVVLDLGTGSGLHAFFACEAGAKKVYAIEREPVIELARVGARCNGYADRIEFIHGFSHRIRLPERVDVVITHVGFSGTLRNLADARRRFLKKGGRLIPEVLELSIVPVSHAKGYRERIEFWSKRRYGMSFDHFRSVAVRHAHETFLEKANLLASPKTLSPIRLSEPFPGEIRGSFLFQAERRGLMHGVGLWPSYQLSERVRISARPPLRFSRNLWPHLLLPLERPLRVRKGQKIRVDLGFYPVGAAPSEGIWKWSVETAGHRFEQSNLTVLSLPNRLLERRVMREG